MEVSAIVPKSYNDWIGKITTTVYVPGCNFECHACNAHAIVKNSPLVQRIPIEKVFEVIYENEEETQGICITGGEPLMQREDLLDFCEELKANGFKVKVDTNGSNSKLVEILVMEGLADYIALDVKNQLTEYHYFKATGKRINVAEVLESIQLVKNSGVKHEFRTTYIPKIHSPRDIYEIARTLHGAKRYVLQQFTTDSGTFNAGFAKARIPSYDRLLRIAKGVKGIQEVRLRTKKGEEVINSKKESIPLIK